jgi:hypothetical protein
MTEKNGEDNSNKNRFAFSRTIPHDFSSSSDIPNAGSMNTYSPDENIPIREDLWDHKDVKLLAWMLMS